MPLVQLSPRGGSPSGFNPIYIVGFIVAGVIIMGAVTFFIVKVLRRTAAKRIEKREAVFSSVHAIMRDVPQESISFGSQARQGMRTTFSRDQIHSTVVLPEKCILQPSASFRGNVLEFHRHSGNFPYLFAPRPFSFAHAGADSRSCKHLVYPFARASTAGTEGDNRFSTVSVSPFSSSNTTQSPGTSRKVRRLFTPILPDELLLASIGERLTVIQTFNDGWCIVGRGNSIFAYVPESLFAGNGGIGNMVNITSSQTVGHDNNNFELGVVPVWCFIKGPRTERPIRSSSLGIMLQIDAPGPESRNGLMSWSNF